MAGPSALILASASPRRAELLTSAGFSFSVRPADVDETITPGEPAHEYVLRVAAAKARAVPAATTEVVLAADTAVVVGEDVLGKPRSEAEAAAMLSRLSGTVHRVLTGVVVRVGELELGEVVDTRVHMVTLSTAEVAWYLTTGEYRDKAGGYAIQGGAARFIDRIEGSWSNVVGLPLAAVHRMLKEAAEVD